MPIAWHELIVVEAVPLRRRDHRWTPAPVAEATNALKPAPVIVFPPPKSSVPAPKNPPTVTFPCASTTIPRPASSPGVPNVRDETYAPLVAESVNTNTSSEPAEITLPPPKSTVPTNAPVM